MKALGLLSERMSPEGSEHHQGTFFDCSLLQGSRLTEETHWDLAEGLLIELSGSNLPALLLGQAWQCLTPSQGWHRLQCSLPFPLPTAPPVTSPSLFFSTMMPLPPISSVLSVIHLSTQMGLQTFFPPQKVVLAVMCGAQSGVFWLLLREDKRWCYPCERNDGKWGWELC